VILIFFLRIDQHFFALIITDQLVPMISFDSDESNDEEGKGRGDVGIVEATCPP